MTQQAVRRAKRGSGKSTALWRGLLLSIAATAAAVAVFALIINNKIAMELKDNVDGWVYDMVPHTTGVLGYELWLFDRYGTQVFHSTNPSQGWDGTTPSGLRCRQGTYTWRCRYRDTITPNGYQTLTGSVTLLR